MSIRKAIQGHGPLQRYDVFLQDENRRIEEIVKEVKPRDRNLYRAFLNLYKIFRP